MATDVTTMTDSELDARLSRLYRQHCAAPSVNREAWHTLIVAVLDEQKVRRDASLGVSASTARRLTPA